MTNLGKLLRLYAEANNIDERKFALAARIKPNDLSRVPRGQTMDAKTFVNVMKWLTEEAR